MLYILTIGICIGVALGLVVPVSIAAYLALLLVSALSLVFGRRSARALIVALACAAIVVGLARAEFFMQTVAHENVLQFAGKQAVIDGVVVNDPERRDTSLRLEINVATIDDAPARGVILAEVPRDGSISYGDRVRVRGAIMAPQAFDAEGGRQFDYPIYLRVHGIGAIMYRGSVLEDARGGFSVQGSLFAIKHAFESSLDRAFVEPDTSLIKGVLLGERHGLPADLESALVAAGLIHIVILAGYALSIVSRGVLRGLAFIMPKRPRLGVSALLLVAFVLMTGAASTTVRASIMALIAMLARALERPSIARTDPPPDRRPGEDAGAGPSADAHPLFRQASHHVPVPLPRRLRDGAAQRPRDLPAQRRLREEELRRVRRGDRGRPGRAGRVQGLGHRGGPLGQRVPGLQDARPGGRDAEPRARSRGRAYPLGHPAVR